jgi:rod shape-determining protein MreD
VTAFLVALVAACLFQPTLVPRLAIGGIQPDLFLILVFWLSLSTSAEGATTGGFLAGLYQDALSGAPLGLHAFTLTLVGFLTWQAHRVIKTAPVPARFALLLLAGIVSGLTALLVLRFFEVPRPMASSVLGTVLPAALYTGVLGAGLLTLPRLKAVRGHGR